MSEEQESAFLEVVDCARDAKTSSKTIYRMVELKQLPAVRFGRLIRIPRAAWERVKRGEAA